ncbi:MAG: T9SS type A sorting domain-containing protein [Flavobacteriales bacterium]|nr:T9SS type A sorting domain-containing protein [Flavobacteriales bacterium]
MTITCTRTVLAFAILSLALTSQAATYYVSNSGNDTNNGTSQATAWQTIGRVNQISGSLQPGDKVLFQRGGLFRGKLTISSSGTAANKIEVGAYGSGDQPVISGSIAVANWTVQSGNIWRAPVSQAVKQVYVNGQLMEIARYPNTGWLRVDQGTTTTLTDAAITQPTGTWNGATAVIRTTQWSYDTAFVTAQNGSTLTHTSTGNNLGALSWGYFLRNKLSMLDAPNEWFYDGAAGYLYLQCPGNVNPNNLLVEAAVLDNAIYVSYQRQHIKISEIAMRHNTAASLRLAVSTNLEAMNCTITDTWQGIYSTGNGQNFHHNTIRRTYGTGVYLIDNNTQFNDNILEEIAMQPGLGEKDWGYIGFRCNGTGMIVQRNRLTDIGYIGMTVEQNSLVEQNVIKRAMRILNDGGGIALESADGMIIRDNIVMDLVGNVESCAPEYHNSFPMCHGIYFGNYSNKNTLVQRNTVTNCSVSGIHVDHTMVSSGNQIKDNILFNNLIQLSLSDYSNYNGPGATAPYYVPSFNTVYSGNILYAVTKDQLCMQQLHVYGANWVDFGTFSNNMYYAPYNDRSIFLHNHNTTEQRTFTLERWQSEWNEDLGSTRSPLHLEDKAVTEIFGTNPVPNSTFASNVNGWGGWPTQALLTHDQTHLDAGCLKVDFSNNASSNVFTLKHNTLIPVQNGQWYRMKFSIVSTLFGEVEVGFKGQTQLAGLEMEGRNHVTFDTGRRDATFYFQSTISDQGSCSFANTYTEGTYFLDNVQLDRVSVIDLDPFEKQQLLINDQGVSQSYTLDGCWSDLHGGLYNGAVTLPAYTSVVLVKEPEGSCMTTGVEASEAQADGSSNSLYPNPVSRGSELNLLPGAGAQRMVRGFTMNGELVWEERIDAGIRVIGLPADLGPGAYVVQITEGDRRAQQRLIVL